MKLVFSHPEHKKEQPTVIPVFMPFAGCRVRCVFCSQTAQTGKDERSLAVVLHDLETTLCGVEARGGEPVEVAFYGGTFTGLPLVDQGQCLEVARRWSQRGLVTRVRCSTRPDCIDRDTVRYLQDNGVSLIELGVQSFADTALRVSKRNYTGDRVRESCRIIREEGLELGIQLMPGLPGASLQDSADDILEAVTQKPVCVRLYPCLVFSGTSLAVLWAQGRYTPLTLEETVPLLASACLAFWEHDIPIIRMGVAPEPSAMETLLAGPFHYSLGSMVRGQALYNFVTRKVRQFHSLPGGPDEKYPLALSVPKQYQGEFWGFKGCLKTKYSSLGVGRVMFHDEPEFILDMPVF